MRTPSSVFAAGRKILGLLLVAGSIAMVSGQRSVNFSPREKAAYAPAAAVQYVNPGLKFTIVSAKIASDGTISVDYKVTDGSAAPGLPLDTAGILTPGAVSPRFLVAYIPKGQSQYVSYIVTTATAVTGGATGTQASGDSGGTTTTVTNPGEYLYTFKTKAPAGFDATATHRIAVYGSRSLTQWNMGTYNATALYDFVPAGGTPVIRDVVRDADCNACHATLSFHGGSRVGVGICIMCHTPQTVDPNTGNTVDMKVFIHKIHMGASLPSVKAGGKYQIYGHNGYSDYSTVVYPSNPGDPRDCQGSCHNPKNGATQTNAWLTTPSRAACGSCHDTVNFATGANHAANSSGVGLPEVDDTQCTGCHTPQGELPFDASIIGAHTTTNEAPGIAGLNFTLVKVAGAAPGKAPTVTFTVRDNSGKGIPMSYFTANSGSLSLTMAGPTTDYGYTSFGSDTTSTPGYVTEAVITGSTCASDGTCTYTFTHVLPSASKGTYAIGIEGRLSATVLPGTTQAVTTQYGGTNQVIYFSVDGSTVAPRRTVVAMANCNNCHRYLEVHGGLRNNVTYCVICHNPSNTDFTTRPTATVAADKALPNQAINFALMVHKIHGDVSTQGQTYIIVGHGGSHNDFSNTLYPAMNNGSVGDVANCAMCHTGGSQAVFPIGKNPVRDPQGLLDPAPATTSACTACHLDTGSMAHAYLATDPKFGESCSVCHASGAAFDVNAMHANQ